MGRTGMVLSAIAVAVGAVLYGAATSQGRSDVGEGSVGGLRASPSRQFRKRPRVPDHATPASIRSSRSLTEKCWWSR